MNNFLNTLSPEEIFYLKNIESLRNHQETTFSKNASRLKEKFILEAVSKKHPQIF